MTREEAIKILRREIECLSHTKCEDCILEASCNPIKTTPYDSEYIEAYEIAIKALEQEPKDGHWIAHEKGFWSWVNKNGERDGWIPDYECSECGSRAWKRETNYCPQCGAKMVEPQESEDKG